VGMLPLLSHQWTDKARSKIYLGIVAEHQEKLLDAWEKIHG
jgi:hypothetical protein